MRIRKLVGGDACTFTGIDCVSISLKTHVLQMCRIVQSTALS
jgi:hypothetical protein